MNQHQNIKDAAVRKIKASKGFCSESEMKKLKNKVKETKELIESLPRAPVSSPKAPNIAETEDYECLICMNLPPEKVFVCAECEGTLCESCKTQLERTYEQSQINEPLSCPQCRSLFVSPGNPIRSRKAEKVIKRLLEQQ